MRAPPIRATSAPFEIFPSTSRAAHPEKLNEYFPHGAAVLEAAYAQAVGFRTGDGRRVSAGTRGDTEKRKTKAATGNVGDVPRLVDRRPELTKPQGVIRPNTMAATFGVTANFSCAP